jgi:hypothetical protein
MGFVQNAMPLWAKGHVSTPIKLMLMIIILPRYGNLQQNAEHAGIGKLRLPEILMLQP